MRNTKSLFRGILISLGFLSAASGLSAQDLRVIQLAKLEIDSAQLNAYAKLLKEEIETAVRIEPGVLMLYALADKKRPMYITILEVYRDSAAYHSHIASPHFLKYKLATKDMVKHLELIPMTALVAGVK